MIDLGTISFHLYEVQVEPAQPQSPGGMLPARFFAALHFAQNDDGSGDSSLRCISPRMTAIGFTQWENQHEVNGR
jgi:hypothetical protein